MTDMHGETFWLVWREGSRDVGYKHATRTEADDEAKRLADENPGWLFYVTKTCTAYARPIGDIKKLKLQPMENSRNTPYPNGDLDSEIPF